LENRTKRNIVIYVVLVLLLVVVAASLLAARNTEDIQYDQIISYFEKGQVSAFKLEYASGNLTFEVKETDDTGKEVTKIYSDVVYSPIFYEAVMDDVLAYNEAHPDAPIKYDIQRPADAPWWLGMLPYLLLVGLMVFFWFYMMRKTTDGFGGGKISSFGKAKVKPRDEKRKTTFDDVAGADEEKEELVEIVDFLKNPRQFSEIGARIPHGVLLMGPPGTGKTLLARAVAGEAGVPFYSISGSDFVEMFVGVGASRVRDLFEQAKKTAPSIVFIDEIDAVGRHRGAGLGGGHDEREQTLNQLLVEMDGFDGNEGVIVIAATNRRDILDPALLRPGRFDREIVVNYPDVKGREEILRVHARNKPLAPDVDLKTIARSTAGFTGADLENLLNEGALLAARRGLKAITMAEVEEATLKVIAGPEKRSKVVSERDKKITAYHEAGHAVVTHYLDTQSHVHTISIIARGMAAGYTISLPEEDKSHMSKKEMEESIVVLLGGRVAEKLVLDDICTGASNDLERASKTARAMVTKYGFSEKLGPVVYGSEHDEVFLGRDFSQGNGYSENVAAEIDAEIRQIIDTAYERCRELLTVHMDQLHQVADYLLEHETMDAEAFRRLMDGEAAPAEEVTSEE